MSGGGGRFRLIGLAGALFLAPLTTAQACDPKIEKCPPAGELAEQGAVVRSPEKTPDTATENVVAEETTFGGGPVE